MSSALIEQQSGKGAGRYARRRAAQGRPVRLASQSHNPANRRPGWVTYALLAIVLAFSLFPLYYTMMFGSSTQLEVAQAVGRPPRWLPSTELVNNLHAIFTLHQINFWMAFGNSVLVAVVVSVTTVFFSTLAGFSFSKLNFRGKKALYVFIIATMAIPMQLGTIPMFIMFTTFGWIDSLTALILPSMVGAFGVFWMTQYLSEALPYELVEAARVDGASLFRTFWSIALPASRPAAATLALFTFVGSWNNFFWPSVILRTEMTMPLIVPQLQGAFTGDHALVMTGVFVVALPLLVVFVFLGRQLVSGVMAGAVKG